VNLKAISKNVGLALLVSALFMLICVIVSIADGRDTAYGPLLVSFLITFFVGLFPFIFVRQTQTISLRDGYVIIVLSWLLSFVFGMMPYVLWGGEMSIVDALFESVSGYTTTGATILNDIEALPRSLLLWRSCTHFIGGLGVVVFLLLIVPSASPFRKRLTKMEVSSLSKEGYQLQNRKLVKVITLVYLGIFAASTISLFFAGMPAFDAINHGLSLCATGGFSIRNASIAAYDSPAINIVSMVFMVLATINFVLLYTCFVRRSIKPFIKNSLARYYLTSILVLALIAVLSLKFQGNDISWGKALMDGFCTTVSYITTTGFTFCDNSHWPFLASAVLMIAALQCACAGSTSSGIKVDRLMVAFSSIGRQIQTNLHPTSTRRIRYGEGYMLDEQVLPVVLYIVLYLLIVIVSVGLVLACGVGAEESFSGAIACMGNVGPGLGEISAAGNYDSLPVIAKLVFIIDMFLGRIEIYPLLIVVSMLFKNNR